MAVKTKKHIVRVNGHLKEITTVHDEKGDILHKVISPIMVELHGRDILQIIVGASILAIPVGFTEEAWHLGTALPFFNIVILASLSLLFIAAFVYYNYYRNHSLKKHWPEFIKRTAATYFFALLVVAVLLTIIQKTPWATDALLAFKRTVIVSFPASMSAAVADTIK